MNRGSLLGLTFLAMCASKPACARREAPPPPVVATGMQVQANGEPPKDDHTPAAREEAYSALERTLAQAGLVEVKPEPGLRVSLVYATDRNFTGRALYDDLPRCWLRPEAAKRLAEAAARLRARRPELALLVVDCTRPVSVQRKLWQTHPNPAHVADPTRGSSAHNHGCAVDVTLAKDAGSMAHAPVLLDLGTGIDEFSAGDRLTIRHEARLCREGVLSPAACANRRLLRAVMTEAGFTPYEGEWWHFSGCDKRRYPAVP
jgi:zinc D-Ala-D-Ala dipeptidase